jgi:hypothetical protein
MTAITTNERKLAYFVLRMRPIAERSGNLPEARLCLLQLQCAYEPAGILASEAVVKKSEKLRKMVSAVDRALLLALLLGSAHVAEFTWSFD